MDCEHELRIVMVTGKPDPHMVVCRRCRARWRPQRVKVTVRARPKPPADMAAPAAKTPVRPEVALQAT